MSGPAGYELARHRAGIRQRLVLLAAIRNRNKKTIEASARQQSYALTGLILSLTGKSPRLSPYLADFFHFLDFSFAYRVYQDKRQFVAHRSSQIDFPLTEHLALGASYLDPGGYSDSIVSVADRSVCIRDYHTPTWEKVSSYQRGAFARFLEVHGFPFHSSSDVLGAYRSIAIPTSTPPTVFDIASVQSAIRIFMRKLWPILGSYVPHHLNRLCDPTDVDVSSTTYVHLMAECQGVLLDTVFDDLRTLRIVNRFPNADQYLSNQQVDALFHRDRLLGEKWTQYAQGRHADCLRIKHGSRDHFTRVYSLTITIYSLVHTRATIGRIGAAIAALFNHDRVATHFLDWPLILSYLRVYPAGTSPISIFISILMLDPAIGRRFPMAVGLGAGTGRANRQIFSLAHSLVKKRQARHITGFLRKFIGLTGPARDLVFSYLCDKSIADRLYSVFAAPSVTDNSEINEARVSETRIEILKFVRDHAVGDTAQVRKVLREESGLLRSLRFAEIYGRGRAHINTFELEIELEMLIVDEFNLSELSRYITAERGRDAELSGHFATVLSDRLVQHMLFQSDYALDAVLSNNLRHGVIEPRIISAIQAACRDQVDFGRVAGLQSEASSAVVRYLAQWLTINPDGPTLSALVSDLRERFIRNFRNAGKVNESSIAEAALVELHRSARNIVVNAEIAFAEQVVPEILASMRGHTETGGISLSLQERLAANLERAFEEVRSWLSVSDATGDIKAFNVLDLARFESGLFLNRTPGREAPAQFFSERRAKGHFVPSDVDIIVNGRYFDAVFTVIHNLISNATKYSGLGPQTNISFRCRVDGKSLTFRLENDVSRSLSIEDLNEMRRSALLAAKAEYKKGTYKEGKSGFKKIRRICTRDFGGCLINIPIVSPSRRIFIVEITVDATMAFE